MRADGMRNFSKSSAAAASGLAALAIVLAMAATAPATAQTADVAAHWQAMTKCAAMKDATARHACADDVMRRAGLLKDAGTAAVETAEPATPQQTQAEPEPETPQKTEAKPETPKPAATLTEEQREAFLPPKRSEEEKSGEPEEVAFTVKKAIRTADRKLALATTEGVIWRQLYSVGALTRMPLPKTGDAMTVRKGVVGGYFCKIERLPSFRCRPDSD